MQFHSCGEEDILIGSFFAISPQSSQLGAQSIAVGGEGQGAQEVGSALYSLLLVSVGRSVEKMMCYCSTVVWK